MTQKYWSYVEFITVDMLTKAILPTNILGQWINQCLTDLFLNRIFLYEYGITKPQLCLDYVPLHWCHNDHGGVSNHQPRGCLLDHLFRRRWKKTSKLRVTGLCAGNSPGPVNSPHKGPVMWKMFQFDDIIMAADRATQLVVLWQGSTTLQLKAKYTILEVYQQVMLSLLILLI